MTAHGKDRKDKWNIAQKIEELCHLIVEYLKQYREAYRKVLAISNYLIEASLSEMVIREEKGE